MAMVTGHLLPCLVFAVAEPYACCHFRERPYSRFIVCTQLSRGLYSLYVKSSRGHGCRCHFHLSWSNGHVHIVMVVVSSRMAVVTVGWELLLRSHSHSCHHARWAMCAVATVCSGLVGVTHTTCLGVVLSGLRSGRGLVCSCHRPLTLSPELCVQGPLHVAQILLPVGMNVDVNPQAFHGACVQDLITQVRESDPLACCSITPCHLCSGLCICTFCRRVRVLNE